MQEPPWMPRTMEEYRQQLAEDAGPQPDEMVRLQQSLDAAEQEVQRLTNILTAIYLVARNGLAGGDGNEALREIEMLSGGD